MDNTLRSALSMVNILIVDTNEYAPVFETKLYHATLAENSPKETPVAQVKAFDPDQNRLE